MRVLITGSGRTGTNWLTEIVRASEQFDFTKSIEDRQFFQHQSLPERYGTKLATENAGFDWYNINRMMEKYDDLKIIFSIRHPVSTCMSKIVRGQPSSRGGDASNSLAPDATVEGSIKAVCHTFDLFVKLKRKFPNRVIRIKLEDLIHGKHRDHQIKRICKFLKIEFKEEMLRAYQNTRNRYHKNRYGKKIDNSQKDIYKNWPVVYNGFFKNKRRDIDRIQESTKHIGEKFGYEICNNVYYTGGTAGDAYIILCKLYNIARENEIIIRHYTKHDNAKKLVKEIYKLSPNIKVEFVDKKHPFIINGGFEDKNKYDVEFYPKFEISGKFNLPKKYSVLQVSAGINNQRRLASKVFNSILYKGTVFVLVGSPGQEINNSNAIDLRGKTDIKEVINIIRNADHFYGYQGLLSFIALSQKVKSDVYIRSAGDAHAVKVRIENVQEWKKYYRKVGI